MVTKKGKCLQLCGDSKLIGCFYRKIRVHRYGMQPTRLCLSQLLSERDFEDDSKNTAGGPSTSGESKENTQVPDSILAPEIQACITCFSHDILLIYY